MRYNFDVTSKNGRRVFVVGEPASPDSLFKVMTYGMSMLADGGATMTELGTFVCYRSRLDTVAVASHGNERASVVSVYSDDMRKSTEVLDTITRNLGIDSVNLPEETIQEFLRHERLFAQEVMA